MATARTHLGRMAWVDQHYRNSGQMRLIFNKGSKLSERPSSHLGPLSFTKPCSIANALEILKRNHRLSVFCFRNKLFADDVVCVPAKSLLFLSCSCHFPNTEMSKAELFCKSA